MPSNRPSRERTLTAIGHLSTKPVDKHAVNKFCREKYFEYTNTDLKLKWDEIMERILEIISKENGHISHFSEHSFK